MEMNSENINLFNSHTDWLVIMKEEYKKLIEENIEFSPNTRKKKIRYIWNIERKMPILLERQSCMNL